MRASACGRVYAAAEQARAAQAAENVALAALCSPSHAATGIVDAAAADADAERKRRNKKLKHKERQHKKLAALKKRNASPSSSLSSDESAGDSDDYSSDSSDSSDNSSSNGSIRRKENKAAHVKKKEIKSKK
eukprot:5122787-Pleurochrysis_carterae.AAC.1